MGRNPQANLPERAALAWCAVCNPCTRVSAIKIATWNLERPGIRQSIRGHAIQSTIERVGADIWVLTESRVSLMPPVSYSSAHSRPHPDRRPDPDERWVSIWSRWQINSIWEDEWSVTVLVDLPQGELLIHGVVLPYMNEPGPAGLRVAGWSRFREELRQQGNHWMQIRSQYPALPVVVAGDLNQNLDSARWYGSHETRRELRQAIEAAGLKCLTDEDVVTCRKLRRNHLVDHVLATEGLVATAGITCWEPTTSDGLRMSDHPGVAVQLALATI